MSIRAALIGNMNNAMFSLMRYLRDLGVDAHLYMYTNELDHFLPWRDTWNWDKWSPYVHILPCSNGGRDAFMISGSRLWSSLDGYDVYIGNGIAPVLFSRMGKALDLFIPYAEGVEFIVEHQFSLNRPIVGAYSLFRRFAMQRAIRDSVKKVITFNRNPFAWSTLEKMGVELICTPMITLYDGEENAINDEMKVKYRTHLERMQESNLVIISHVSHIWRSLPTKHFMGGGGKRNHWLIQGFAEYIRRSGNTDALLCLFEYGVDVIESKRLIKKLGVDSNVIWFPPMERRELMALLPHADIGGGEFAGMMWGGCGWEFLSCGVPMLHWIDNVSDYDDMGISLPPFFNVASPGGITDALLASDKELLSVMGDECRSWYSRNQGKTLARRYVELLRSL